MTTRRGLLGSAIGLAGAAGLARAEPAQATNASVLPFYGPHQNGIACPQQAHASFAAFDVITDKRPELVALMQRWTAAAARLTQGLPAAADAAAPDQPPADSGDALDLPPSRLTLTFGVGATLFSKDGGDRFGLARLRPAAFIDLPRFVGDKLVPERSGGDLAVQACADDPQVAMHAVRALLRLADGIATLRWAQTGFIAAGNGGRTPRNLMGFKDGTSNVAIDDLATLDASVWAGDEAPRWLRGGSYVVARPIRIALEHWDRMKLAFQEQTVGRHKPSGAPLGAKDEFAPADFAAQDADGNPVIPENSHVRLASPLNNAGARMLRRSYSYDNGASMVAERWPPWRHNVQLDAGLLFICYQRDPRTGFVKVFERMSKFDMLNQFVTHVGGGMFACPGGVAPGRHLAQDLFEATVPS